MLGREVSVPADLVFCPPKPAKVVDHEEYVTRLQESIQTAHEVARDVLKTHQVHMKRDYDVKIHTREYAIGNIVYVLDSAKTKGRSMKLAPTVEGTRHCCPESIFIPLQVRLQNSVFVYVTGFTGV